jgi:hypothetical protein
MKLNRKEPQFEMLTSNYRAKTTLVNVDEKCLSWSSVKAT